MKTSEEMIHESATCISAEFPQDLFEEIQRIAGEENWPLGRAVVLLARLGAKAQKEAEATLSARHADFMAEQDAQVKDQRGDEMLRSIFGPDSIA